MVKVARPEILITAKDYFQMPEGPPYFQLVQGSLSMSPSPDHYHQDIVGNLHYLLRRHLADHPTGKVMLSPSDVELTKFDVYQPDLYYVSHERRRIFTKQGVKGAPDLVVEVLSRSTARLDKGPKKQVYAQAGVEELWFVDKDRREISVFRLGDSLAKPAAVFGEREELTSALFPGLRLRLAEVFAN